MNSTNSLTSVTASIKKPVMAFGSAIVALLFIAGCSSPAPLVSMPKIPPKESDKVTFTIVRSNTDELERNVVQSRANPIPLRSSVVISVPDVYIQYRQNTDRTDSEYRSLGYFNIAEQQIEKELLRAGFQVKDRSKFEAILRDLRDQSACNINNWRECREIDPQAGKILEQLETQMKNGDISIADYSSRVKEVQNEFKIGSAGNSREAGAQELTDISEVIRAASASDIQADYILQINEFVTDGSKKENVNLLQVDEVRAFMSKHPEIRSLVNQRQWFPCETLVATLNAKLINVKTGDVVWIGNHSASEFHDADSDLELMLEYQRYVSNSNEIAQWVQYQNYPHVREVRVANPTPPALKYSTELVGPMNVGGADCTISKRSETQQDETRTRLAREVSEQLIGTIKTGDW